MHLTGNELNYENMQENLRLLDPALRCSPSTEFYIDPGFLNLRLAETFLTASGVETSGQIKSLMAQGLHSVTQMLLKVAKTQGAKTLCSLSGLPEISIGMLVCSTDEFRGRRFRKGEERAVITWVPPNKFSMKAQLAFSIERIWASTTRSELQTRSLLAHLSRVRRVSLDSVELEPIVLGGPWIRSSTPGVEDDLMFHHYDYGQIFIDDIDELAAVRSSPRPGPEWEDVMGRIPERAVKEFVAQMLGMPVAPDWGGEEHDFYGRLNIRGRTVNAAFMLKGPAKYRPMSLKYHFGKNADQLLRLANSGADLLVVQHSHIIPSEIIKLIRCVAVQPGSTRRFLLIDGQDTYRMLLAYNKLDWATSQKPKK